MSVVTLSGESSRQYPKDVGQSRHSIFQAADKAYEWYPQLEKRGEELEVFREELEKRVQALAHERIDEQALLKEREAYKQRQQFFQGALKDAQRLVEILRDLDTGFDGLQPMPENDPKPTADTENETRRQLTLQKTKKIANAKMHMSVLKLPPSQLQRKMETSLRDVKSLLRQFKQIANGKKSQENESGQYWTTYPSTLDEQLSPSFFPSSSSSSSFSSSSGHLTISSPPFHLRDEVYEDIASMNQQLQQQELRHPSSDDFEDFGGSVTPIQQDVPPAQFSGDLSTNLSERVDSIHARIDEIQKSDREGLERIRALIRPPFGTASKTDTADVMKPTRVTPSERVDSKPRTGTPPKSAHSSGSSTPIEPLQVPPSFFPIQKIEDSPVGKGLVSFSSSSENSTAQESVDLVQERSLKKQKTTASMSSAKTVPRSKSREQGCGLLDWLQGCMSREKTDEYGDMQDLDKRREKIKYVEAQNLDDHGIKYGTNEK